MKRVVIAFSLLLALIISSYGQKSKIYTEYAGQGDDRIEIIVVSGTPHQMGVELGKHLKDKARESMQKYLNAAQKKNSTLFADIFSDICGYIHRKRGDRISKCK